MRLEIQIANRRLSQTLSFALSYLFLCFDIETFTFTHFALQAKPVGRPPFPPSRWHVPGPFIIRTVKRVITFLFAMPRQPITANAHRTHCPARPVRHIARRRCGGGWLGWALVRRPRPSRWVGRRGRTKTI